MKYQFRLYDCIYAGGKVSPLENVNSFITPDISDLKIEKKNVIGEIFSRVEVTGLFKIFGADFDLIYNYLEAGYGFTDIFGIEIYQNGEKLESGSWTQGVCVFYPRQIWDVDKREMSFKAEFVDKYSPIMLEQSTDYNIINSSVATKTLNYQNQTDIEDVNVSFPAGVVTGTLIAGVITCTIPLTSMFTNNFHPSDPISNWTLKVANYVVTTVPDCMTYECIVSGTATFYRHRKAGHFEGVTAVPPAGYSTLLEVVSRGNVLYPIYIKAVTATYSTSNANGGSAPPCDWVVPYTHVVNSIAVTPVSTTYTGVLRLVDDLIEWFFEQMDATILFDSLSFAGLDNFTGKTVNGSNKVFRYLSILTIYDFIPDAGAQKSDKASKGMLSFEILNEYLKSLGFYYYLETIGSSNYYRIIHKTQQTWTNNNPKLSNYLGKNYSLQTKNYKFEEKEYYLLRNKQIVGNLEFIGTDLLNKLDGNGKIKEVTNSTFFTDSEDIYVRGTDAYDETSDGMFVMLCCYYDSAVYYVRNPEGLLSEIDIANGDLAWTNVIQNLVCDIPFTYASGNDTSIYPSVLRQAKLKKIELNVPCKSIRDFEFESYVEINNGYGYIESYIHEAEKNTAELKLKL